MRGINVGGGAALPMKEFVALLEGIGIGGVETYIQTGNAVFRADGARAASLPKEIAAAVKRAHGFAPDVMLLSLEELERALAANPFPEAEADPRTLHLMFLSEPPPHPDLETLEVVRKGSERFALKGKVLYLHAPEGIGRSKLFARAEKALGVAGTARNWRTASRVREMAREAEGAAPSGE